MRPPSWIGTRGGGGTARGLLARRPSRGEERALPRIVGEGEGPPVLGRGLRDAPEAAEEIGAGGGKQVISAQGGAIDPVEGEEAGRGPLRQADGYRAVQLDDR